MSGSGLLDKVKARLMPGSGKSGKWPGPHPFGTEPTVQAHLRLDNVPGAALDAAIHAARIAEPVLELPNERRKVFVPKTFTLEDVTDPHELPPYIKARVVVDEPSSLAAYANRFSDTRSVLVADYDAGTISAHLDWHVHNLTTTGEQPSADAESVYGNLDAQPCRHVARLVLRASEEFKRWDELQGKLHPQAEFAAFLEENAVDIVDPDPTVMIEISRDLEATQGVVFKSSTRLENGDRGFVYETETKVRGELKVPREFALSIPLYHGGEQVTLRCAFRWRFNGGGLALGFEWRRVEYQRRAHFAQIATAVAEATGLPVFFGRVEATGG